jgi:hypothetical protein
MLRWKTIRTEGSRPFRAEAFRDGVTAALAPQGLASRDVPAARRGPRMRQGERGSPSRQKRVSSLRKRNTGRKGTASRELKPVSASGAQSFYAPGSSHLGSRPRRHLHQLQVDQWAELGPLLLDRDQ